MHADSDSHDYSRVLKEHRELQELLERIDEALAAKTASIEAVGQLLGELGDRLVRHFSAEEEGGYFSEALLHAPQLVARANDLMAQHPKMCSRARDLLVELEPGKPAKDWWQETRERYDAFRAELVQHERGENRLIQEAYNRDMGPSD